MRKITPAEREVKASRSAPRRNPIIAEIMAEKALTPYVRLICGHLTTREEIESNQLWQTKPNRFYCCNCGKWVDREPPKKSEPLPDEPMF